MEYNKEKKGYTPKGVKVNPLSTAKIRALALKAREIFGASEPYVDIVSLLEFELSKLGVMYDFCEEEELGSQHGVTFPNKSVIKIREDVYDGACSGLGRDRFTISHELGHLFMHDNVRAFARTDTPHKAYEDSEWQANTFAAEFLMPVDMVKAHCTDPQDIMYTFGVSWDAAQTRWNKLKKEGLL